MIHEAWLLLLLTVLAVARLTRLVTADQITRPARMWVIAHRGDDPDDWLVYLVHCRWCASIWISAPVAVAVYAWHQTAVVQIALIALAASHATGLLAGAERD